MSSEQVAPNAEPGITAVVRQMHGLVTYGPWDLDISSAMSLHGYDQVKWMEGQAMLAELVSINRPSEAALAAAMEWYDEAARTARQVLVTQPRLLAKLGVAGSTYGDCVP